MLPLADIKYVEQLDLADELYLDVPDDEERLRQLDVDPAVRPPHRVHVRHEGPHAGLPHLELHTQNYGISVQLLSIFLCRTKTLKLVLQ